MKITIPGQVMVKKNSQMPIRMGKRTIIIAGKPYQKYEKASLKHCLALPKWKGAYPVIVEMFFYRETLRRFDFDNVQSSVLDVLVKANILEDDSMRHVIPKIKGHGWEKDKDNPRVEIEIKQLED